MCGIFGVIVAPECKVDSKSLSGLLKELFVLSESRGKEASGIALNDNGVIHVLKSGKPATKLISSTEYLSVTEPLANRERGMGNFPLLVIGHSRLMTNGKNSLNINNQPVSRDGLVGIHNGIIVNDEAIWEQLGGESTTDLDTESLLALVAAFEAEGLGRDRAISKAYQVLEGNASVALLAPNETNLCLATNNGSLYYWNSKEAGLFVFASEKYILEKVIKNCLTEGVNSSTVVHVVPSSGVMVNAISLTCESFSWQSEEGISLPAAKNPAATDIIDHSQKDYPDSSSIKRCTRCILPETFPHIEFDDEGVCNLCNSHELMKHKSMDELMSELKPHRSKDGSPDCLVGLSGGRDSCFGLHVVKNILKMNPIAYTYDWGLVTDSARRNIARMCGKLGVEHILISADIPKKRANVRKNIQAWLKKPSLAMIPLFTAGDKQFYYYAHQLRKQTGVDLFMFCAGNDLERTEFKTGFCGLKGDSGQGVLTQLSATNKYKLMANYALEFLRNPSYLNSSLIDSLWAFYSSYVLTDDYVYLYHYYPWEENEVNSTLKNEYQWEGASDTTTTWRVGDGTAAFYNYIYYAVAGFTEHDTFRSNQVREGLITREEALKRVKSENRPRWESLEQYAQTIGFNLDEALLRIHAIPKLYH